MELSLCPFFLRLTIALPLLHLLAITSSFSHSLLPLCHYDERIALLQFKDSFIVNKSASDDPSSRTKIASWKPDGNSDCCSWDGVKCDEETGHVVALDLNSSNLYGSINSTSSLFHLSQLQRLNLAHNHFNYSQIPPQLGNFSRLVYLNLSGSFFSGQIPSSISQLSGLLSLDLSFNINPSTEASLLKLEVPSFDSFIQNLTHLEQLRLSYVDIASPIPSFLSNFSHLTSLRLFNCGLNGEFPNGIFQLPELEILGLGMNQDVVGQLPHFEFDSPLRKLSLFDTGFFGSIPSSVGKLVSLQVLDLGDCRFSGVLPFSVGNLTRLTGLYLGMNNFSGQIPPQLGNLTGLTELNLQDNKFFGCVPSSFTRLKSLQILFLFDNMLAGTVDFDMFLNMTHLFSLQLSGNKLSVFTRNIKNANASLVPKFRLLDLGSCNLHIFPDFLRYQDSLSILYLYENHIHGLVPKWMWNVSTETLEVLVISDNFLTGFEQPPIVLPWVRLSTLDLSYNIIKGTLPIPPPSIREYHANNNSFSGHISPLFCNLSSLVYLDLSHNELNGTLPECKEGLSNSLIGMVLSNNFFHGRIPDPVCSNRSELMVLDLSHNQFEGKLPRSLVNCSMLECLSLENNQVDDIFPYHLGTLSELKILILRSNHLHGVIEPQVSDSAFSNLHIVDLSHNRFSGLLPTEYFKRWIFMETTDSGNTSYMRAEKNSTHEGFTWVGHYLYAINLINKGYELNYGHVQGAFVVIDFSSNRFEGEIPECLGNLTRLQVLNLSNNILTGSIPSSLANLAKLESLDLSGNKLHGRIPEQLTRLNFLAYFNVSNNQLTGSIPHGNQFDTFGSSSFQGNLGLCGNPLPKKCGNSEPLMPLPSHSSEEEDQSVFQSYWMTILPGFVGGLVVGWAIEHSVATEKHARMVEAVLRMSPNKNRRRERWGQRA